MSPTVSVIIACYNGSSFLKSCVRSVMSQNVDSETIIVDDGSTDTSVEMALKILRTEPWRGILICQTNQGAAAARNRGNWKSVLLLHRLAVFQKIAAGGAA